MEVRKRSPLTITDSLSSKHRSVRIKYSLLRSLAVGSAGFLRLCMGTDEDSGEIVLALTDSSASPAKIPQHSCVVVELDEPSTLVSAASNLISERILSLAPPGSTVLLNEADDVVQAALRASAAPRHVTLVFITSKLHENKEGNAIFVHPNFPRQAIRATIPASVAVFVHFSQSAASDAVRDAILSVLPSTCLKIEEGDLLAYEVDPTPALEIDVKVAHTLKSALSDSGQATDTGTTCIIALADAVEHPQRGAALVVVDWCATTSVPAKVRPIDSGTLFRADKTYLFVGMAGELGQSLAEWMIKHGARNVVLTSRTPKVNPRFINDMQRRYGALIEAQSLDITSRQSLDNVLGAIRSSMPPIAGVVNGAMILEDELFANMTLESFRRVTAPKVVGTQMLDQAFHDTSLEFFVVTSSIASVIGWTGQSNYSAANEWMTSLVAGRRARGVAASTVNIPAVLGVGYAAHAENFDFDYFQSLGHINISEEDLHALFAEAILSGRPSQTSSEQVGMGVTFIPPDLEVKAAHKRDIKFSHFVQREEKRAGSQTKQSSERVKTQLQGTKTAAEAYNVVRDAFLRYLKRLLRIAEEEKLDDATGLVDQGVDSLVAVDIRAWFLKELGVDVPTLKILGGGPIADLVRTALEKMPELAAPKAEDISLEQSNSSDSSSAPRSPASTPTPPSSSLGTTRPSSVKNFEKSDEIVAQAKAMDVLQSFFE